MKSSDTSSESQMAMDQLDFPPSYDASVQESAESSSAPASQAIKHNEHLYAGPPNAEPILGRQLTPAQELEQIVTITKGKKLHSWDNKLSNPDTLYDFLRVQALKTPGLKVKCTGAHMERSTRDETYFENGQVKTRRRGHSERVIDFDFFINLSSLISHTDNTANVHLYTVAADTPAHRGTHRATYSAAFAPPAVRRDYYSAIPAIEMRTDTSFSQTDPGRVASRKDKKLWNAWQEWRRGKGLPGWSSMLSSGEFWESNAAKGKAKPTEEQAVMLREMDTEDEERGELARQAEVVREGWNAPILRESCDKYARDYGWLKEFRMKREVWGWDMSGLETAIRGAINSTGYESNDITVAFELEEDEVVVHPNNMLSRALGNAFVHFLLWITLVYPLIWIWQRLSSSGGARYDVARASYCAKFYPPLPSTFPNESVQSAQARLGSLYKLHPELPQQPNTTPTLALGPKGVHYLLGRKEGEWYREWEERIRMGVRLRYQGELQGSRVDDGTGPELDGY